VAQGVVGGDQIDDEERQRTPAELATKSACRDSSGTSLSGEREELLLTAVMLSMQSTLPSLVRYRESESEYSFHSWPKTDCSLPMARKLVA
jgi:hypothetical protein